MKHFKSQCQNIVWICKPIWKYGKGYLLLAIIVMGFYSPIDDLIYVRFPEIMIDLMTEGKSFSYIAMVAALICGASFLINAIRKIVRVYFTKKQEMISLQVNREIYDKALCADYRLIDNPEYYDQFAWAVKEYANQVEGGKEVVIQFTQNILSLIVLGSIIVTLGPWILLVELVQMLLHTIVHSQVNTNTIRLKEATIPLDRRLEYFHRLFYLKEYAADMKSTPLGRIAEESYDDCGNKKVKVLTKYTWRIELLNVIHEVIFLFAELIIVLYLVKSIVSGRIPEVGMYMTLMLSFYRLDSKIDALTYLFKDASILSMNVEKIRAFFSMDSEIEKEEEQEKATLEEEQCSVELKDVSFSYENSDFKLSNLNLTIKAGEKIAIVGENGAGKSTFVKLLLRLYDVKNGTIYLNERPIQEYDVHQLRSRIGVAFQNTNIYAMSLKENVSLYQQGNVDNLQDVAEQLGLDEIVRKNCADYNAELTREFYENGILLSGGEAQKIGLARVMCGEFSLLLLDEPSSALDPLAEYKLSNAILSAANQTTTILVSHRLSNVRDADRIVVMDHGTIGECGTHEELMACKGLYYEMFTKQAENYVK